MVLLDPCRLYDSRDVPSVAFGAGETREVQAGGVCGVPVSGVAGILVNITPFGTTSPAFMTIYPSGTASPSVAQAVSGPGQPIFPTSAVSKLGVNGAVNIYNASGAIDIIVDIYGFYPASLLHN
jgi:hypothetical protein